MRGRGVHARAVAALIVSLAALLGSAPSASSQDRGVRDERPHSELHVAMPAFFDLGLLAGAPFELAVPSDGSEPLEAIQRRRARRRVGLQRGIEAALSALDLVRVDGEEPLRAALSASSRQRERILLAQERLELGRERYLSLEPEEALTHLDRARALLFEASVDLTVPERFAEVEFQRGLALAELGREAAAAIAFQGMFLHDPARRFAKGWFGPRVESLLERAAASVRGFSDAASRRFAVDRLAAAATTTGVRYWLVGVVSAAGDSGPGARLELQLHDILPGSPTTRPAETRLGSFAIADALTASQEGDTPWLPDAFDRWLTAWHTCALELEPRPLNWRPDRRPTWFIDISLRHEAWLSHRQVRDHLHGPGVQIGLQWEPTPLFQLWARFAHVTTLPDRRGDLLDRFGTTRIGLGGALRLGGRTLSVAFRVGLEGAVSLTDLTATSDVNCKFFGPDSPRCGRIFNAPAPLGWFGLDTSMLLRWQPARTWYLALSVGVSSYVLGREAVRELNFPVHTSLGVGATL